MKIQRKENDFEKEPYVLSYFELEIERKRIKSHNELSDFVNSTTWNYDEINAIGVIFGKYDKELRELYLENIIIEAKEVLDRFKKSTFNDFNQTQVNANFFNNAYKVLDTEGSEEIKELLLVKESDLFNESMYQSVNIMDVNEELPGVVLLENAVKKYIPKLNELGNLIK